MLWHVGICYLLGSSNVKDLFTRILLDLELLLVMMIMIVKFKIQKTMIIHNVFPKLRADALLPVCHLWMTEEVLFLMIIKPNIF